jgi:hypothetical protein
MKWVVLAFLTLLAGLASLAVAQRTKPSGRAELALTTTILWNAMVGCPIYALGLTGHLTANALGWLSGAFSALVLVAAAWRGSALGSFLELAEGVVDLFFLPFAGLALARKQRSLVLLPLLLLAILIPYTIVTSYFSPSWRQWDSLWYHETIVGFTIQTHRIGVLALPGDLEKVNGYPRFCEMVQLWFTIFTDRRLIELPNSLLAPGLMYAVYVIARRYTRDVVACMAWAAVVMIMPNSSYLLQSTYIDLHVGLIVLAGMHYATRPVYRLRDAWLTALCVTLAVGAKYLALPTAGIVLLIGLARLVRHHGLRLPSLATALGGGLLISGMSATIFWANWVHFKNPLWPDLQYDNAARGIHLPFVPYNNTNPLDMNMGVKDLIESLLSVPYSNEGLGPKNQLFDYGIAVIWVVFPLGALGMVVAFALTFRHTFALLFRIPAWRAPLACNAFLLSLPLIAQVMLSPALWGGRYHISGVGALACLVAFLGGRPRWSAFGEGAAVAAAVMSLVVFYWVKPRWLWYPSELAKLAAIPYPEREVTAAATISKSIWIASGAAVTKEVGLEREKLKPGEIVAFSDGVMFPALLWNNAHTNKLVYVPAGAGVDLYDRVLATGARWIFCRTGDPNCAPIVAATSGPNPTWRDVGMYNNQNWGHIYARLTP